MKKLSTIIVTILAICSLLIAFSVTASAEVQPPAIAAVGISYEAGDTMYMYFKLFIGEDAAADQQYGMIFWKEKQADDGYKRENVTVENAVTYDQTEAVAETFKGHPVKVFKYTVKLWEMADVVYAQGYMIDGDGKYTYSDVIPYSFVTYVRNKIGINETNASNVLVTDVFLKKMQAYLDLGTVYQEEKMYNLENKANEVVEWNNQIQYELNENGDVVVKGYKGSATGVYVRSTVIGGEYHGKTIVAIGDNAFSGDTEIKSVTLPETIEEIGDQAFKDCTNLEKLNYNGFPEHWKDIPKGDGWVDGAGKGDGNHTGEAGGTGDGDGETGGDTPEAPVINITIIIIEPKYSKGLEYTLNDDGKSYSLVGIGTCTDTDIIIPRIHNGLPVTKVRLTSFLNNDYIKSFKIPDGVTSVNFSFFAGCSNLDNIFVSSTVSEITCNGWSTSTRIKSITIDDRNKTYHASGNCIIETKSKTLILGCMNSVIPDDGSVTTVGDNAFNICYGLTSITIPNGVTSIGWHAFHNCRDLTSITIPESVTSIKSNAFAGCSNITSITVEEGNTVYHLTSNCVIETESKTLVIGCNNSVIPDDGSVTSIGDYAFFSRTGLTSITIPDGVTRIGYCAFEGYEGLSSITIPESVTYIGYRAFCGCNELTSITVDEKNPVYHSAGNCLIETASKTLIVGNGNSSIPTDGSVTKIDDYAFCNCTGLKSVTIPESVTSIGGHAFFSCYGLKSITIPNGVTIINNWTFAHCWNLTNVSIPTSVVSIGDRAFYQCNRLALIEYGGTMDEWNNISKGGNWDDNTGLYTVVPAVAPTIPTGTMVYYEDFNNASTIDELGWTKLNISDGLVNKDNTATYVLDNGRLKISGGSNESHTMVKNSGYMRAACLGDYTVQYDVEYTGAPSDNMIYFNLLTNFMNYRYCNSVHFRLEGTADNQVRYSTWYDYDVVGAYDADGLDTDATGQSVISKLTNGETTYVEGASPMLNRSFTVKLQVSRENGITVWARDNTAENAKFVCISKADTQSSGWQYWNAINAYAICLKTRPNITGYIDNIAIWTGLGDMPTDHSTTAYETAIAGN